MLTGTWMNDQSRRLIHHEDGGILVQDWHSEPLGPQVWLGLVRQGNLDHRAGANSRGWPHLLTGHADLTLCDKALHLGAAEFRPGAGYVYIETFAFINAGGRKENGGHSKESTCRRTMSASFSGHRRAAGGLARGE